MDTNQTSMQDGGERSTSAVVMAGGEADGVDLTSSKTSTPRAWKTRIDRCKKVRREKVNEWAENVDFRRGKPFQQESDAERINVNLDWSLTKGKHAQLYSQTPQVYLTPKHKQFEGAVPVFAKRLNEKLTLGKVGAAVDEAVLDAINASGIGVAMVGYETRTEMVQVPDRNVDGMDPEVVQGLIGAGLIEMIDQPNIVDSRTFVNRLSPSDFLWDTDFVGSDFDNGPWVGRSDRMQWPEAMIAFKLTEADKEAVCGTRNRLDTLRQDAETNLNDEEVVEFDEIFYWAYRFDPEEKYFHKIRRMVFVHGKEQPVIDEDWTGQKFDGAGKAYVGACKFPIRVLTLTYISDDAIPPSDSAVGRPQVLEMIRSRSQIIMQREHSLPIRWFNPDRVDTAVGDQLMRGIWQGFIPLQGGAERAIGEVARANYPQEEGAFNAIIKQDLQEQWQVGSNQLGNYSSGERSASEARIVQQNFQSRIGYERGRVSAFFCGIAEVMAGYIALYDNFEIYGEEEIARLNEGWDRTHIAGDFTYYIRPDSTILLDANQRVDQLMKLLNLVGKSGYIEPEKIISEIVALHGLDPADVMTKPQPPAPELPKIAFSFKGEDLTNEMVIAILMKSGQAPSPEDVQAAKHLKAALTDPEPLPVDGQASSMVPPVTDHAVPSDAGPMERITKRTEEIGG